MISSKQLKILRGFIQTWTCRIMNWTKNSLWPCSTPSDSLKILETKRKSSIQTCSDLSLPLFHLTLLLATATQSHTLILLWEMRRCFSLPFMPNTYPSCKSKTLKSLRDLTTLEFISSRCFATSYNSLLVRLWNSLWRISHSLRLLLSWTKLSQIVTESKLILELAIARQEWDAW